MGDEQFLTAHLSVVRYSYDVNTWLESLIFKYIFHTLNITNAPEQFAIDRMNRQRCVIHALLKPHQGVIGTWVG